MPLASELNMMVSHNNGGTGVGVGGGTTLAEGVEVGPPGVAVGVAVGAGVTGASVACTNDQALLHTPYAIVVTPFPVIEPKLEGGG